MQNQFIFSSFLQCTQS